VEKLDNLLANIRHHSNNPNFVYTCQICNNSDGFPVLDVPMELETPKGEYFDKRFTLSGVECTVCGNIQLFHRAMTRPGDEPITIEPRGKLLLDSLANDQQKD